MNELIPEFSRARGLPTDSYFSFYPTVLKEIPPLCSIVAHFLHIGTFQPGVLLRLFPAHKCISFFQIPCI